MKIYFMRLFSFPVSANMATEFLHFCIKLYFNKFLDFFQNLEFLRGMLKAAASFLKGNSVERI